MSSFTGHPTVLDLVQFHTLERQLYTRLTGRLGLHPEVMKSVMALWMWLESTGCYDFIHHVTTFTDDIVVRFAAEAKLCLDVLFDPRYLTAENYNNIPLTSLLINKRFDLSFFIIHRDLAMAYIGKIYFTVCRFIFDSDLVRMAGQLATGLAMQDPCDTLPALPPLPPASPFAVRGEPQGFFLFGHADSNIWAPPLIRWQPPQPPEDERALFITFSKGHPITREDIADFFNARYDECVQEVKIQRLQNAIEKPHYGRLIVKDKSTIAMILNGQDTAKFVINGKHLWCRKYRPRQGAGNNGASSSGTAGEPA